MFCQTRRSTTPTKLQKKKKPNPQIAGQPQSSQQYKQNKNTQTQSQEPLLTDRNLSTKQKIQPPAHTQTSTMRDNCQSPTLTFVGSQLQSQIQGRNDLEQALRLALEMVEINRKGLEQESKLRKGLEEEVCRLKQEFQDKQTQNKQLQQQLQKQAQKYKKLKQKYKDLKQQKYQLQKSSSKSKTNIIPYQTNPYPINDSNLIEIIEQRNKTIKNLCIQIQEYQQNSQNILQMINVLEQKVQELTMDNNLLKGILRENQISQSDSCATVYNVQTAAAQLEKGYSEKGNFQKGQSWEERKGIYGGGVFANVYENLHGGHIVAGSTGYTGYQGQQYGNGNFNKSQKTQKYGKNTNIGDRCIEGNRFIKEYQKMWNFSVDNE